MEARSCLMIAASVVDILVSHAVTQVNARTSKKMLVCPRHSAQYLLSGQCEDFVAAYAAFVNLREGAGASCRVRLVTLR